MDCGGRVYGAGSDHVNSLLHQSQKLSSSSSNPEATSLDPLWLSRSSSPPSFHASETMVVNFDDADDRRRIGQQRRREGMILEDEEENSSGVYHQPEKKRRLTAEQVQYLEKSFEVENRLEPDRKVQLANELGLQPRQVAIWFQNRRARFKTKQLEKDYDSLKADYDNLMAHHESILKEKDRLKNEVSLLVNKLKLREKGLLLVLPDSSDPRGPRPREQLDLVVASEDVGNQKKMVPMVLVCKQEDASSAKSDVVDSDSPPGSTDVHHSSLLEPANSSNIFEPEQSDFSQDEDDHDQYLSKSLLLLPMSMPMPYNLPKLEDCNSGTFGLPAEDQQLWSWLCQT
ncbi:hypothetical protein Dimus_031369 [Dionaea muscipula]